MISSIVTIVEIPPVDSRASWAHTLYCLPLLATLDETIHCTTDQKAGLLRQLISL